jgi:hypothetical protein
MMFWGVLGVKAHRGEHLDMKKSGDLRGFGAVFCAVLELFFFCVREFHIQFESQ